MIRPGSVCTYNAGTNFVNCECPDGTVLISGACEDEDLSECFFINTIYIINFFKIDHQSFYI